ncbi:hypothetical protein PHYPO_G00086950 [Pangasianodon hypophthalmus]|uniref:Uncharacterized protein n=1 Tax=Pangasianodon hypophthalmus TaxID=310915 RepID=A0A5N5LGW5_PANHP|nr:hypothetical protein PHYPO_G00086950 [Pangasianodon hypophthalmus]
MTGIAPDPTILQMHKIEKGSSIFQSCRQRARQSAEINPTTSILHAKLAEILAASRQEANRDNSSPHQQLIDFIRKCRKLL